MKKQTAVISAFPACGKSYMVKNNDTEYLLADSDSMKYSWVWENGVKTDKRNPDFLRDYIKHIKDCIGVVDVVFVSSHKEVRQALRDAGIKYFMVHPSLEMKDEMIERMRHRGNDENFINFQTEHYEQFVHEIKEECERVTAECKAEQDKQAEEQGYKRTIYDTPFLEIELSETQPYIDKGMIYHLMDNSMGNLSSMWLNHA